MFLLCRKCCFSSTRWSWDFVPSPLMGLSENYFQYCIICTVWYASVTMVIYNLNAPSIHWLYKSCTTQQSIQTLYTIPNYIPNICIAYISQPSVSVNKSTSYPIRLMMMMLNIVATIITGQIIGFDQLGPVKREYFKCTK